MTSELFDGSNVISNFQQATIYSRAYSAHIYSQPIKNFQLGESISQEDLDKILRGLANIALGVYGNDYSGLTKEDADSMISGLSGSVDDFIFDTLADSAY